MCFTPAVSLTTAIIEFIIVIYLFKIIKDKRLRALPYFVFFLGLYQLTEFFLCTTDNFLWSRLGFAAYTMLPILLMQLFYDLSEKKLSKLVYSIPLSYIVLSLIHPDFIVSANCEHFFVSVRNLFFSLDRGLTWLYLLYYGLFPIAGVYSLTKSKRKFKKKGNWKIKTAFLLGPAALIMAQAILILIMVNQQNYDKSWVIIGSALLVTSISIVYLAFIHIKTNIFNKILIAILVSSIGVTYILYQLFPGFGFAFASIYCHFAILYSIAAILLVKSIQSK